ncbi:hypothetical protein GF323_01970 [Candidatus Woesearchaeota archaeon]|nr:hypothetical protein [Candidatus Woesearchaeota archaeon]
MEQSMAMTVKENKATIKMLEKKLDALIEILNKEGITTLEEVDALSREKIEKNEG